MSAAQAKVVEDPARIRRAIKLAQAQRECLACGAAVTPPAPVIAFVPIASERVFCVPVCDLCRAASKNPASAYLTRLAMHARMVELLREARHAR